MFRKKPRILTHLPALVPVRPLSTEQKPQYPVSFAEQVEPQEGDLNSGFCMRSQKPSFVAVDLHAHVPQEATDFHSSNSSSSSSSSKPRTKASVFFAEQVEPQEGDSYSTSDLKSGFRMRSQKPSFVSVDLHAHVPLEATDSHSSNSSSSSSSSKPRTIASVSFADPVSYTHLTLPTIYSV